MLKTFMSGLMLVGTANVVIAQDTSLDDLLGPTSAPVDAAPAPAAPLTSPADQGNGDAGQTPPAADPSVPPPPAASVAPATAAGDTAAADSAAKIPAAKAKSSGSRLIEEIVVTAQKREESISSVPIAISAFSGEKLDALGITSAQQLPKITPGLTFSEQAGYPVVYLRGVGSNAFLPSADPVVPFYLDGVALISGHGVSTTLGRVSRVEVLKGPQGTLFGRNSTGGAISIVTPNPTDTFSADVSTELGNLGTFNNQIFVNAPIYGGLGATIAMYDEQHNTYNRNTTGPTIDTYSRGARIKLVWDVLDNLSFNIAASYGEESGNSGYGAGTAHNFPAFSALTLTTEPTQHGYRYESNLAAGGVNNSQLYAGGGDLKLPWVETKIIASYQKLFSPLQQYDYDGSAQALVSFDSKDEFFHQGTGEIQFLSTPETPLVKYFSWVAGGYYLEGNGGFPDLILRVGNSNTGAAGVIAALPILSALQGPINNVLGGLGLPPIAGLTAPVSVVSGGLLSTRSSSGYFQGTFHLQDIFDFNQQINIVLGARIDKESRALAENRLALVNPVTLNDEQQVNLLSFSVPKTKALQVPVKALVQWFPTDTDQIYAAFSRGFTAPTYSTVNFTGPPNAVAPSKVNSYELGAKFKFLDGALSVNSAVFLIDQYNVLTGFAGLTSGGIVQYNNIPRSRIKGTELDFIWQPLPTLDEGLVLIGSASYLNAKFLSYPKGTGYDPVTGIAYGPSSPIPVLGVARDFKGNDIDRTPHFTYNAGLNQSFNLDDNSRVEFNFGTTYTSHQFFDGANTELYAVGAHQTYDVSATYVYKPWGLEVTGFGKNITATYSTQSVFLLDSGVFRFPIDPRTYGIRVKYTF